MSFQQAAKWTPLLWALQLSEPFSPNCKIMNIKADHILYLNCHFCIIFSSYEWFLNYNLFFWKQMFMGMILRARNFNYDNFCILLFLEPYAYFSRYWKWLESSRIIRKLTLSQTWITRGPIGMLALDLNPKMSLGDTANFVWCNIAFQWSQWLNQWSDLIKQF